MTKEKLNKLKDYKIWECLKLDGYDCKYIIKHYGQRGLWVVYKDGELVEDDKKIKSKLTRLYTMVNSSFVLRSSLEWCN